MIINELTVTDFRAFSGEQTFSLAPTNKLKPIVLFGGLNGAGKTSTLTAIKLAFLGRESLGKNVSRKEYEAFLAQSIHRKSSAIIKKRQASVALTFTLSNSASSTIYKVSRSWSIETNGSLIELIQIYQDGVELNELSSEQCQSFLKDIIPPGVANLFFFDGEKISELADDTNGAALSDSIKKLIGVDLVDTLNADLKSVQRRVLKRSGDQLISKKIEELETELKHKRDAIKLARINIDEKNATLKKFEEEEYEQNQLLQTRGGAWANAREDFLNEEANLTAKMNALESQLREIISASLPLGLAPKFSNKVIETLEHENTVQSQRKINDLLTKQISGVKNTLLSSFNEMEVEKILDVVETSLVSKTNETALIHDISDSQVSSFKSCLLNAEESIKIAQSISHELNQLHTELERLEQNISRAPDDEALASLREKLESTAFKKHEQNSKITQAKSELKSLLNDAINITLELRKLNNDLNASLDDNRIVDLCVRSSSVVAKFAKSVTSRKVKELESELKLSYSRLARKKTFIPTPKINPETFHIVLFDDDNAEINKDDMSAGEKQIFAIALLEALGKVSGKQLPVIIDTPLGRLDSHHRENILLEYFPKASHQVIILSTDTEINEDYQAQLSKHISHSIKLDYSEETKSTVISEGYFWNKEENKKVAAL